MKKKEVKKVSENKDIGESLGISGFTLGVLSILLAGTAGVMISVVGFIFCFVQQRKNNMKLGKVGMILNIIGFILSIAIVVLYMTQIYPVLKGI